MKNKRKTKNQTKGITLIALVVTIVILLILAGVSINLVLGPNGLISKAQEASLKTDEAQEKEGIEMAISSSKMEDVNTLEISKDSLENALREQFGNNKDFTLTDNGDGSFLISMNDTQRSYYVENTGDIIDESNMIEIGTAEELKAFRDDVNSGNTYEGKYVYLTNDITLDISEEWETIGKYLSENTSVTDETNIPFKGIFDGQNHTIQGLRITSEEKGKGLFGLVNKGIVKNVIIGENCDINAGISFGSISGYLCNSAKVINCTNNANVSASANNFGGIVGTNMYGCSVEGCTNNGILTGDIIAGGIVGYNMGNIQKCRNINKIISGNSAGGISGYNSGVIKYCFNKGNINSEGTNVGGITGNLDEKGIVNSCYNIGNVEGKGSNIGGIVGHMYSEDVKILNSYNIGNVLTDNNLYGGGIVGVLVSGTIENCYLLENTVNYGNGITNQKGVKIMTDDEIKEISTILGEDFKEDTNNINSGYPILNWQ